MKWKFDVFDDPEFIRIVPSGSFSAAGIIAMFDDLFSLKDWHFLIPLLLDTRNLEPSGATSLDMLAASSELKSLNQMLAFTKLAVILRSPESLERASRVEQATAGGAGAETRMFLETQEAMDWLVPTYSGAEPKTVWEQTGSGSSM